MKYLVRISNSHREISMKEIETIFSSFELKWINDLLVEISIDYNSILDLAAESISIKWIIENPIYHMNVRNSGELLNKLTSSKIKEQTPKENTNTFAVRFEYLYEKNQEFSKNKIERELGAKILNSYPRLQVDLEEASQIYLIFNSAKMTISGWKIYETGYSEIAESSPKESPFFSGGAMKAMISKLLINLLYPQDNTILDPFSGHGGFLREISAKNRFAIGLEINWKVARENHMNNRYHKDDHIQVMVADALNLPIRENGIRQIVTDPPYAKQTTTIGRDREKLIDLWLEKTTQDKIIMTLPQDMDISIPNHLTIEYECFDYVHRSLTRVVRKLVKRK